MKTQDILNTPLEKLGFSIPTIHRLQRDGLLTLADIVKREEQMTAQEITSLKPTGAPSIYGLPLLGNMLSLLSQRIKTIPELLQLDPDDRIFRGNEGTRVYATAALIELGYSEKDGIFLSKEKWANFMRNLKAYRFVDKLDKNDKLSNVFKRWFNEAISGRLYNQDRRSNRTLTVQRFKLE